MTDLVADLDAEEFEERHKYLTMLAKSADYTTRGHAEHQLAELNRLALAGVVKVGPKGYIHGWIFVGPQAAGTRVHHGKFGHGTVRRKDDNHVHVLFDSGKMHSFQHAKPGKGGKHFVRRADHEATRAGGGVSPDLHRHLDAAHTAIREGRHADAVNHLLAAENHSDGETRRKVSAMRRDLAGQIMYGSKPKEPKGTKNPLGTMTPAEHKHVTEQLAREGLGHKPGESRADERKANARALEILNSHRAGGGKPKGLSDKEFADRQKYVEDTIGQARNTHATDLIHSKDGAWTAERDKLHREIADDLYANARNVPNDGEAVVAGGLGGAGKTTILTKHAGIDPSNYLTVNPDDIKEELAKRGLVPDVPGHPDLSPMERSALVHEESSRIAKLLADKAYRDKKNMIWDITMSSGGSVQSRIDDLHKHGYKDVKGIFVDIPVETSVDRALDRYRRGVDDFHAGKGFGGRYVPPSVIRAQKTSSGRTINRQVFDGLRDKFDDWSVYDNSGDFNPQLVESKGKVKSWRR